MAGVIKKCTGLTRLAVAPNPHYTLTSLYSKILRALTKMPQDAAYRRYTEQIVNDRLKVVQTTRTVSDLEAGINNGQAEELILQAERELVLARKMLGWKPWEPLMTHPEPTQWQWPPSEKSQQK